MKAKVRPGQVSIMFSEPMLEQLRKIAQVTDCSIADVVRKAVAQWLVSGDARKFVEEAEESAKVQLQLNDLADRLLSERERSKS